MSAERPRLELSPAPWAKHPMLTVVLDRDGEVVCSDVDGEDAALIIAAPAMFKALSACLSVLAGKTWGNSQINVYTQARDALALARPVVDPEAVPPPPPDRKPGPSAEEVEALLVGNVEKAERQVLEALEAGCSENGDVVPGARQWLAVCQDVLEHWRRRGAG